MELFTGLSDQQQEGCSGGLGYLMVPAPFPMAPAPGVEVYVWNKGEFVDAEDADIKGKKKGWDYYRVSGLGAAGYYGPKGQVKKLTGGGGLGFAPVTVYPYSSAQT